MAKSEKKPVAPIYSVAVLWVVWGLLLPLHSLLHYILAVAASVAVFCVAKAIWPNKTYETPDPEPEKKEEPKTTGNPEIDALIKERDRAISEMRRLNDSIEDPTISAQIDQLEATTAKIVDQVVKNPEKLSDIRRFMNYYLPTTLKLLNAYDQADSTGISGANVDGTKTKVADIMETIVTAFDKQLDSLFGAEALDISTDITVLEQMLAREGIGGTQIPTED